MYRSSEEELIMNLAKFYANNQSVEVLHKLLKDFEQINNGVELYTDENRVLVIGDIHEPFTIDGYLEHCVKTYQEYNCNKVIFIGDIIDNHYSSFHNADPDGLSAGEELKQTVDKIKLWYKAFPNADIIIGNHDKIVKRKAFAGGLSKEWIKDYKDVLNTPNWNFVESLKLDNVLYIHGEGGTALKTAQNEGMSVVQGHIHTESYVRWINNNTFALQTGCGVDRESYAMGYAKHFKQQILSCAIILNGKQAILSKM